MAVPSILLISGSTRENSTNSAVLNAAASVSEAIATCTFYRELELLPQFNPDIEAANPPTIVRRLRDQIAAADSVLISTPEYAGAMPGALKNLIEWTIDAGSFSEKPVGWINCSPRDDGARLTYESLRIVLGYAGALVVEGATARIPVSRAIVDDSGKLTDADTISSVLNLVSHLAERSISSGTNT